MGSYKALVSVQRRRYAPETSKVVSSRVHDWRKVDWNKSNSEIVQGLIDDLIENFDVDPSKLTKTYLLSLEHQVSRRRTSDAPWSMTRYYDWTTVDWNRSNEEIARETGFTSGHVWEKRREHAPETMPSRQTEEVAQNSNWYKKAKFNPFEVHYQSENKDREYLTEVL